MRHASLRAWLAVAIPPLAWATLQQGWGQLVRQACGVARLGGLSWDLASLALLAAAASLAWPVRRAEGASRFVATIALGETIFFGLAMVFQLLAGLLVPPCWR